jgi:2-haloacid dehalogenase
MEGISAVVFDLYGTLYDVHSVALELEALYPGEGLEMSRLWRQKQLEYTWLRSLMGQYINFESATYDALRFCCAQMKLPLDTPTQERLCSSYLRLRTFSDTFDALRRLKNSGLPLGIVSNGSNYSIAQVVDNSDMRWAFNELISADDVAIFKPDSRVYALAEQRMDLPREQILFVSSNAWDATGATHFGFPVCWINRQGNAFDELGARPKYVASNLGMMTDMVLKGV